jgi:hypothetical protein
MSDEIIPGENTKQVDRGKCGIVMPISGTDGYPLEHWSDVLTILTEVATDSGFSPEVVSNANDVGIIQTRIIQNLNSNEMVICDVSSKKSQREQDSTGRDSPGTTENEARSDQSRENRTGRQDAGFQKLAMIT